MAGKQLDHAMDATHNSGRQLDHVTNVAHRGEKTTRSRDERDTFIAETVADAANYGGKQQESVTNARKLCHVQLVTDN